MLPKPEKNKKTSSLHQLDLVESLDGQKKSNRRRLILIISLFLTIGLSFIFWLFSGLSHFSFSLPKINLADKQPPSATGQSINLNRISNFKSSQWSIQVTDVATRTSLYTLNASPLSEPEINSALKALKDSSELDFGGIDTALPSGVNLSIRRLSTNPSELNLLVDTPAKQLVFHLIITDTVATDQLKPLIPLIIQEIYWSIFNSVN